MLGLKKNLQLLPGPELMDYIGLDYLHSHHPPAYLLEEELLLAPRPGQHHPVLLRPPGEVAQPIRGEEGCHVTSSPPITAHLER